MLDKRYYVEFIALIEFALGHFTSNVQLLIYHFYENMLLLTVVRVYCHLATNMVEYL